jgi:hypothetical protein
MNKAQAGRKGGFSTVQKYGREHMQQIGARGARTFWSRYRLAPAGTSDFAVIRRDTGEAVAFLSGRPWEART